FSRPAPYLAISTAPVRGAPLRSSAELPIIAEVAPVLAPSIGPAPAHVFMPSRLEIATAPARDPSLRKVTPVVAVPGHLSLPAESTARERTGEVQGSCGLASSERHLVSALPWLRNRGGAHLL